MDRLLPLPEGDLKSLANGDTIPERMPPDSGGAHLSPALLQSFLSGGVIAAETAGEIESHLEHCQTCSELAASLSPERWVHELISPVQSRPLGSVRLAEGYEILDEIGRGGAGVVYRARQASLDRLVALKMLISGVKAPAKQLARFHREAAVLAKLQHPHIVQILDNGEQEGVPFLAMELIEGPNLAEALQHHLPEPLQAAKMVADLANAIKLAHRHGIVHRDLKPQNVLLAMANADDSRTLRVGSTLEPNAPAWLESKHCLAKLVDFGLSSFADDRAATATGDVIGTPAYVAPEMVDPRWGTVGPATDVYGLGAILYECLFGHPPFQGTSAVELLRQVVQEEPLWHSPDRKIPIDLLVICQKCLEKRPAERLASAELLERELTRFVQGLPIQSRPLSRWEQALRWVRRNPWPTAVAGMVLLATSAILVMLLVFQSQLVEQRDRAQDNYDRARAAIWDILNRANQESAREIPKLSELHLSQLRPAVQFFEHLAETSAEDQTQLDLARIRIQMASNLIARRESAEGEALLLQALAQLDGLQGSPELRDEILSEGIAATVKYGLSLANQQRAVEGKSFVEPMVAQAEGLCGRYPEEWKYRSQLSWVLHNLACICQLAGELQQATKYFEQTIRERELAFQLQERQLGQLPHYWALEMGESYVSLATVQLTLGETQLAQQGFEKARELMEQALSSEPNNVRVLCSAAAVNLNLSNLLVALEQSPQALEACNRGIDLIEQVLLVEPDLDDAKRFGAMLYGNRALYRGEETEDLPKAIADWERASALFSTQPELNYARLQWARVLGAADQVAEMQSVLEATQVTQEQPDLVMFELLLRAQLVDKWEATQRMVDPTAGQDSLAQVSLAHDPQVELTKQLDWVRTRLRSLIRDGFFQANASQAQKLVNAEEFSILRMRLQPSELPPTSDQ